MAVNNHAARRALDEAFVVAYTVELLGWPDLDARTRAEVETRFATELERRFGACENVVRAFVQSIEERERHRDTAPSSSNWEAAVDQCRTLALENLAPPESARFWLSFYDDVHPRPR